MVDYLHAYLLLHGHKEELPEFVISDHIKSVMHELSEIPIESLFGHGVSYISRNQMIQDAHTYMNLFFHLHPVGYLDDKSLKKLMRNRRIKTRLDVPFYYNQSAKMVDPFMIPIQYTQESVFAGSLCTQSLIVEDDVYLDSILKELNVYFSYIALPKVITSIATTSYIHEITHTQLESQKGIVREYYHSEVLSIFMELLHTFETSKDNFQIDLVNRLENVLCNFYSIFLFQTNQLDKIKDPNYSETSYHSDIQYFYSIMIAIHLFDFYLSSNPSIQKEILGMIQKVFDGEITLEELLEFYSIQEENSIESEPIKKLIKRVS